MCIFIGLSSTQVRCEAHSVGSPPPEIRGVGRELHQPALIADHDLPLYLQIVQEFNYLSVVKGREGSRYRLRPSSQIVRDTASTHWQSDFAMN
jgi:hypothetical protein